MRSDDDLVQLYAPFGLRVAAGDVSLRVLRDTDLPAFAELISTPVFADETVPYAFDWLRQEPVARLRASLQFLWNARSSIVPSEWRLTMGVFEKERLVGVQDIKAHEFNLMRVVVTGSWLSLDAQGRGIGTLMRQMALVLAFDTLDAVRAESVAALENARSLAVARNCGYAIDGTTVLKNGPDRVEAQRVVVTPETFVRPAVPVEVDGMSLELLELLGVTCPE